MPEQDRVEVAFQPEGKRGRVSIGSNLLDAADEAGVDIKSDCGGKQTCGKCAVIVEEGADNLSPIVETEREHLEESVDDGYRLACAAELTGGDVLLTVPPESRRGKQIILEEGLGVSVEVRPPVKKYPITPEAPSLEDDVPDFERIAASLAEEYGIEVDDFSPTTLRSLPHDLRDDMGRFEKEFTATVLDDRLLRVEKGFVDEYYGAAIDIGTTTVVVYLMDMQTGDILTTSSMMNPQVKYGEDVMARVTMTIEKEDALEKLQTTIVDGLNELISDACESAGISTDDVVEATIVGNTGMHDLFTGIDPEFVSKSPYVQGISASVDIPAPEAGLEIFRGGNVHVLPTIAGWMGADTVGCLITTTPYEQEETQLMIDVGTNGELVLGNQDRMIGASCAAGPALEGAHIAAGMRAAPGAIQYIRIDPSTYEPELDVIDDEPPRGICGSGIIDAAAELVRTGIVQNNGRFNKDIDSERVRERKEGRGYEYVIAWADEAAIDKDIVMHTDDIREVQKAKGAICAGSHILMNEFGIDSVDEVALAGAFGNYIDKVSALIIGLLPNISPDKVNMVGNAAGIGARLSLIDEEKREEAEMLTDQVKYYRLAAHEDFEHEFSRAMYFPHMEVEKRYPDYEEILEIRE